MIALLAAVAWAGTRGVTHEATPPPGLDEAYQPRRVALVVGIDDYTDPALGDLQFAGKDARDLASVLQDPRYGGYDVVSVVSGSVTRQTFQQALDAVSTGLQRDDTLVVYVAAHGTLDLGPGGTELYVLPSDAWLTDAAKTGIRVADLSKQVEGTPARHQVLILDTCYSGGGRSVVSPGVRQRIEGLRGPLPAPAALAMSQFSANLYSANVDQPAIEDPSLENGVYTHFLLQALEGAGDLDGDGLVEVMEAHDWARDRTLEYTGGSQVPWAETVAVGRDDIYLTGDPSRRKAAEHAILLGLEALPAGARVYVDGVERGAGPVETGRRDVLVERGDRRLAEISADVAPSTRIDVGRLVADRAGREIVAAGAQVGSDVRFMGPTALRVDALVLPADPRGARFAWGGSATFGDGPGGDVGRFATGTLVGSGAALWGGGVLVGPRLDAGVAWRLPGEAQGAPFAEPGVLVEVPSVVDVVAGAGVPLILADGRAVPAVSVSLTVGGRIGRGR